MSLWFPPKSSAEVPAIAMQEPPGMAPCEVAPCSGHCRPRPHAESRPGPRTGEFVALYLAGRITY